MLIGAGIIKLRLYGISSLKEKRSVVKPLVEKLRNSFNISVSEIGGLDNYYRGEIGFSIVSNDCGLLNSMFDKLELFVERYGEAEIFDIQREIIHF